MEPSLESSVKKEQMKINKSNKLDCFFLEIRFTDCCFWGKLYYFELTKNQIKYNGIEEIEIVMHGKSLI